MRNIRKTALSGLTTLALVAGGITAANAETAPAAGTTTTASQAQAPGWNQDRAPVKHASKQCDYSKNTNPDLTKFMPGNKGRDCDTRDLTQDLRDSNSSNSSVWGNRYNGKNDVTGRDLLGLQKNWANLPVWAQIWYVVTVLGVIGSVIGLVFLPIVNDAKAHGYIV